jgi:Flp pilus assembly protein TadG
MSIYAGQRGSSIAETAIAMTLALLVFFGIMEFGRMLYTYHAVANAARLGTRYAMVRGSDCTIAGCPVSQSDIQTYVRGLTPLTDPASMTVTTTWTGTDYKGNACSTATHHAGCVVSVTAAYAYGSIVPLVPVMSLTLHSTSKIVLTQ